MADIFYDVDVALTAVPLNKVPVMDVDGLTVDTGVVYNEAGLSVEWNFVTSAGAFTHTAVTPTDTGGAHDFVNQGEGMYTIEIPASAGTINNDTEGYGWFSCNSTATLPFTSPIYGFRAAALNDALCDGGDSLDVNVTAIAANTITAASINADAITEAKIADNALANEHFAAGALTATEITGAAGCAVSSIGTDVITATSIQAAAITDTEFTATGSGLSALNDPTAAAIADAVWDENITEHTSGAKAGEYLTATLLDTAEIGTAGAGLTDLGGMSTAMIAEVNAEVVDALNVDTYTEPGQEAPGVNVSLATKIGYLYKGWRNRSNQTSSTYQLYADDATTVDQKATVSDDATTAEKSEIGTGP